MTDHRITAYGALTIGSETSGGVRNIHARDLHITGPGVDHALRIKTNSDRGGLIEHITLHDTVVESVTTSAVLIDTHHAEPTGTHHPAVRNITLSNLQVQVAPRTLEIRDTPESPVHGVNFR